MAVTEYTFRVGITDPIEIQLLEIDPDTGVESGVNPALAESARLSVRPKCGGQSQSWDTTGIYLTLSSTDGTLTVLLSPPPGAFVPGEYVGWIRLTDTSGNTVSFPSDSEFTLNVIPTY